MCYNCDPARYNPRGCQDNFDPMPEGVELQRMEPQVERLVLQAEKVGFLSADNRNIKRIVQERDEELNQTAGELQEARRDLSYARNRKSELERENLSLRRRIPKKPVTKKVSKK
jgi:hypothetical protein